MNTSLIISSEKETYDLGVKIGMEINPPFILGLKGNLGVGKTVLVKGLASALGVQELVTSPTFLGVSEYYSGNKPLIHMDFYQKVVPKKLIDSYYGKGAIIVIEWYQNYKEAFDEELKVDKSIEIKYIQDSAEGREVIMSI